MAAILIVEDDRPLADTTARGLRESGHEVAVAYTLEEGLNRLRDRVPEVVITDLMLADRSGLDLLIKARAAPHPPDVILVTAHATALTAAQAMQQGAYEYIVKPYGIEELRAVVHRVCGRRALVASSPSAPDPAGAADPIAASPQMRETLDLAREVAASPSTVLLRGESGTGKEEVARYVHRNSPRAGGPFVAINCGAIPENLLASELFGHEKGAFTGAVARRAGAFERASGGTLLLDEIGDISIATQVHLLRAIELREIVRVGSDKAVTVDVRLIAATHRDLEAMLREGTFREDLYYRVNVVAIPVPPLRNRPDDIPALARHFVRQLGGDPGRLTAAALETMQSYTWPGNVRELRNIVENLLIRARGAAVTAELAASILPTGRRAPSSPAVLPETGTLEEVEAARIRAALAASNGNKARAARALGISRRRLYSRMQILGIA